MEIPKKLKDEIWEYCRLNNISNVDGFINKMLQQGYTIEKFGTTPIGTGEITEVEKIVEVPVEKIVEKIVEVPVEKIIEKVVEKEIYITDDDQLGELSSKISDLQNEVIDKEEKINKLISELNTDDRDDKIKSLSKKIDKEISEHSKSKKKIIEKNKEIEKLKEEFDNFKKENNKDIYGDGQKGGWFGSNLLNK
jgi:predicted RNase H-like nuclease (RuvC/YqgF family)